MNLVHNPPHSVSTSKTIKMSAVEERQTEKRALDKGDENDDVVPTKEAKIENGKTEVSIKIGDNPGNVPSRLLSEEPKEKVVKEDAEGEEEGDDEDADDEEDEVNDEESSEGEGEGSDGGDGEEEEGSGDDEDGDDAEGGEESD
ncbi:hypothetical protein GCK72_005656 [Caenorhabditis remanei]|uniref:Uncharacterized protein n=1 Tax=Caenorhabditis remanei TaxID=31234 RepID=A0A6A5HH55_CAERE|nr:hypothetical protein GCK72_005656 [Caenorhabditis remanei]KAF1765703.1 hypothetical protein GCK72_005656 [Caenorhabditis remanei]